MKLQQLAATPKLEKITLDHEDIIKEFGESIEFYVYDRQDLSTYMRLASINTENQGELFALVSDMVYDESGKHIINEKISLPINVMTKVIESVVKRLGNTQSQTIAE